MLRINRLNILQLLRKRTAKTTFSTETYSLSDACMTQAHKRMTQTGLMRRTHSGFHEAIIKFNISIHPVSIQTSFLLAEKIFVVPHTHAISVCISPTLTFSAHKIQLNDHCPFILRVDLSKERLSIKARH